MLIKVSKKNWVKELYSIVIPKIFYSFRFDNSCENQGSLELFGVPLNSLNTL